MRFADATVVAQHNAKATLRTAQNQKGRFEEVASLEIVDRVVELGDGMEGWKVFLGEFAVCSVFRPSIAPLSVPSLDWYFIDFFIISWFIEEADVIGFCEDVRVEEAEYPLRISSLVPTPREIQLNVLSLLWGAHKDICREKEKQKWH